MTLFYVGLSIASSYFVYNPEQFLIFNSLNCFSSDKFYNVGLKTTLIAYGFDFVVFDLLFIVIMLVSKLYEKAPVEFGGYLSKQRLLLFNLHFYLFYLKVKESIIELNSI